MVYQLGLA